MSVLKQIEQLFFPKRVHYVPHAVALGTALFIISEIIMRMTGTTAFLTLRLLLAYGGITGLEIVGNITRSSFQSTVASLESIIKAPTDNYREWVEQKTEEFFTFRTRTARMVVLVVNVSATVTLVILGLPSQSTIVNIAGVVGMQLLFILCGQGAYFLAALLLFLAQIVRYPLNAPFYRLRHPAIVKLSGFYSQTALLILLAYMWLVITIWQTPYGFAFHMLVWLTVIGFYPLAMFTWSFYQVHTLMQRIKQENVNTINEQVRLIVEKVRKAPSKENTEQLAALMGIQSKLEETGTWPVAVGETLIFVITIVIPVANIILSALDVLGP